MSRASIRFIYASCALMLAILTVNAFHASVQKSPPKYGVYTGSSVQDPNKLLGGVTLRFNLSKSKDPNKDAMSGVFDCYDEEIKEGKFLGNYDRKKNLVKGRIENLTWNDDRKQAMLFISVVDGKFDTKKKVFDLDVTIRSLEGSRSVHFIDVPHVDDAEDVLRQSSPRASLKCTPEDVKLGTSVTLEADFVFPKQSASEGTFILNATGPSEETLKGKVTRDGSGRGKVKFQAGFPIDGTYTFKFEVDFGKEIPHAFATCHVKPAATTGPTTQFARVDKQTRSSSRDDGHPYQSQVWTCSENYLKYELVPKSGSYPAGTVTINWDAPDPVLKESEAGMKLTISSEMTKSEREPPGLNVSAGYEVSGAILDLKGSPAFCGFPSGGGFVSNGSGEVTFKVAPTGDTITLVQVVYGLSFSPITVYTYKRGAINPDAPILTRMSLKVIE